MPECCKTAISVHPAAVDDRDARMRKWDERCVAAWRVLVAGESDFARFAEIDNREEFLSKIT